MVSVHFLFMKHVFSDLFFYFCFFTDVSLNLDKHTVNV